VYSANRLKKAYAYKNTVFMINGEDYIRIVEEYFYFLTEEFAMSIASEEIRGNAFYGVKYEDSKKTISISYENIEDYFQVIIFLLQNGQMPNYDDKTKTLHLDKLNSATFAAASQSNIITNNDLFEKFQVNKKIEKLLLKSAKELRLYLKYVLKP
jgi:hypothetical protein